MGQAARNHGGTLGYGYRGHPKGQPDAVMFKAEIKYKTRSGVGVEVVTKHQFERTQAPGSPVSTRRLCDSKGMMKRNDLLDQTKPNWMGMPC